jgi:O-acetyl-ADP-ribose deacetylase (regulator of RNase III)
VREALPELKHVRLVRFVLYDQSALDVYERVLAEVFTEPY